MELIKQIYKRFETPILMIFVTGMIYWNLIVLTDQIIAGKL